MLLFVLLFEVLRDYVVTEEGGRYFIKKGETCPEGDIEIPGRINESCTITGISIDGFRYCPNITSVVLPETITEIKGCAFYGCTNLKSINIPTGVTIASFYCFADCFSLREIVLPDTITEFESEVFYRCTSLTNLVIPQKIIGRVGSHLMVTAGSKLFGVRPHNDQCYINGVPFLSGYTNIPDFVVPYGITVITDTAFYGCRALTSIKIPLSVTTIRDNCFYACSSLTTIDIPGSVTDIGYSAFYRCDNMKNVTYRGNVEIPKDIRLDGGASVYVRIGYPYKLFGCHSITGYFNDMTRDFTLTGSARINLIVLIFSLLVL